MIASILLFFVVVAIHEIGHARLMMRYGVPIREIALLGFGPKIFTFRLRRFFGETPITIRCIPIGAFVEPDTEYRLNRRSAEHIAAGGIAANLMFAGFVSPAVFLSQENAITVETLSYIVMSLLVGLFGLRLWESRRHAGAIVMMLGIMMIMIIITSIVTYGSGGVDGPITIVGFIAHERSFLDALLFSAGFSLAIALPNALPFIPLDGGRVALSMMHRLFPEFMERHGKSAALASMSGMFALLTLAIGSDILRLFGVTE